MITKLRQIIPLLVLGLGLGLSTAIPYSCDSSIYCYGQLLDVVQSAKIFPDSKTFVDMSLRGTVNTTWDNFNQMMADTANNPSKPDIVQFVQDNFVDGNELDEWTLPDYNPNPEFLTRIANTTYRDFAKDIVAIWPQLARKVKDDVTLHPEHYSLIPIPNGFVVPGGRFKEVYYWDSYWVVQGLLICDMKETVVGMLDNFIHIVQKYGFIPNGGRVYYLQRSQPPLLTPMAKNYYEATKDKGWVQRNIEYLAKELQFWLDNRAVSIEIGGKTHTMFRYAAESLGPRPESYIEDKLTAQTFPEPAKQQETYVELKSGAESGWDFSSRWIFNATGGHFGNLSQIQTRRVIPVDLNAFLGKAFRELGDLYEVVGDVSERNSWYAKYGLLKEAIHDVLWDEEDGIWHDYDMELKQRRREFYASNIAPLWGDVYHEAVNVRGKYVRKVPSTCDRVVDYLLRNDIDEYKGGVPTSLYNTGEQWDYNAWPPLQHLTVHGLEIAGCARAVELARELAHRWVEANLIGYTETGAMFEKYDAEEPGKYGRGGEYDVQFGFGWTNGVALEFIERYYSKDAVMAGSYSSGLGNEINKEGKRERGKQPKHTFRMRERKR